MKKSEAKKIIDIVDIVRNFESERQEMDTLARNAAILSGSILQGLVPQLPLRFPKAEDGRYRLGDYLIREIRKGLYKINGETMAERISNSSYIVAGTFVQILEDGTFRIQDTCYQSNGEEIRMLS